ncbi:aminoglycoside 6-adenylyltransferase [Cohnella sp. CFH 77786]|uniref:aminoglycoside 6-adenylyltransferase n=1 Tax=Cohnella sp. CFH 77786 TaxID=2662265 RepID=UPI001C60D4AD|nr:aminoglycoside 6-adenylyltransferase [Cohnella sp. CFH 77786]MBW5448047.1 aminoglycoside 6-adenylyltransferase [Cohnella sp. CFH 77786]
MRKEAEMLHTIRGFAENDDRIRAVMMNGSRANPHAPKDLFQDYDIVYFVSSVQDFVDDASWISSFGDILIMQTPDRMDRPDAARFDRFAYLMLFADGNRIDLTFYPADRVAYWAHDSETVILLDKDGLFGDVPPPSNRDYWPVKPNAEQFGNCCNEFWWVSTYVAKGLWRRQLPYAMRMYEGPVRDMLMRMLTWYIGVRTDFAAESGKEGKYFEHYLEPAKWEAFVQTFANGDYESIWRALFEMGTLFRKTAQSVADRFGFSYPEGDDRRVSDYLRKVYRLPPNADDLDEPAQVNGSKF